jgi:PEP-CTERM motif
VGTPEFFQFSTDSSGTITGWFFLVTPVTTDGKNQINVIAGTEFFESILGPYLDSVIVFPSTGGMFTDFAISTKEGNWSLIDPTPIPVPPTSIPEPSTWAMMLLGFAGLGYARYRRARDPRRI